MTGEEKWRFKTEGSVQSSPVVSEGVVYFCSKDKHLYAVDIKTGEEKWKFETEDYLSSSPAVSEGVVYFGSENIDSPFNSCYLYAVQIPG
jgi:outer membrane protein assembly factor BamB